VIKLAKKYSSFFKAKY